MGVVIALALILVVLTFAFHSQVVVWLGNRVPSVRLTLDKKLLIIVVVLYAAHVVEIAAYAVAYVLADEALGLGTFHGQEVSHPMSYLYYSGIV